MTGHPGGRAVVETERCALGREGWPGLARALASVPPVPHLSRREEGVEGPVRTKRSTRGLQRCCVAGTEAGCALGHISRLGCLSGLWPHRVDGQSPCTEAPFPRGAGVLAAGMRELGFIGKGDSHRQPCGKLLSAGNGWCDLMLRGVGVTGLRGDGGQQPGPSGQRTLADLPACWLLREVAPTAVLWPSAAMLLRGPCCLPSSRAASAWLQRGWEEAAQDEMCQPLVNSESPTRSPYLDDQAGGNVLQHHAVAGFVGCLAPWTVSFHKLLFQVTLFQGEQGGVVLLACHLDQRDSCSRGQQCRLLPVPVCPGHGAHSGQRDRKAK